VTLLTLAIAPKTPDAQKRLAEALLRLTAEDATLEVRPGPFADEVLIGAGSERQLEALVDRLRREFNVEATLGRPQVEYVEAVSRPADGETKYKGDVIGGEYAHVKVRVRPGTAPTGVLLDNQIIGGAIPAEFMDAIEQGVHDALAQGIIGGYPVRDARVDLCDGSYHDVDSTSAAFRIAAARAVREALFMADCVVLEPMMRIVLDTPADCVDAVLKGLASRRGTVQTHLSDGDIHHVGAVAPLADLFGFEADLRHSTRDRGTCDISFAGYAPLQPAEGEGGGDPDSLVGAPRKPAPTLRLSSIALPEPDDDLDTGR
jgi:elongation factor G